jgi:hypothetical protein
MLTYTYQAFGLSITSEIECPELIPVDGAADVRVRFGSVPEKLDDPAGQGAWYQVSARELLLKPDHVAHFWVTDGTDVVIQRAREASDEDIRAYLLGSVFGALLHQRGILPLHASAIATARGAVAFAGPVGIGKSTLAAVFHKRGYHVLADDICAVSLTARGAPLVTPAYPQLNLWADALNKIGSPIEILRRTRIVTEKYGLPVSAQFSTVSVPLHAIYELSSTNMTRLHLTSVTGLDKLALIRDDTFRLNYLKGMDQRDHYMQIASAIAQHARLSRIARPDGIFLLDELADLVENDLRP